MNELQDRTDRLLEEPWLQRDLAAVEVKVGALRARRRRTVAAGVAALVVVALVGIAVAGRPGRDGTTTIDVADRPSVVYEQEDSTVMVFLPPGLTADAGARFRADLAADPAVGQAWWITPEQALAEFRCLFADQPAMIESVTASILPSSVHVALVEGADPAAFESRMRSRVDVNEVIPKPTADEIEASGTTIEWRPEQVWACSGTNRGAPVK